ncbi:MAG TPA: RecX family transcriptional regulator [Patescibacteria group bacterium]|nr:RecX family transcriptional regulator [Patescibacteria group bacterium]
MKITSIKQQVKRRDRFSVFVDGSYAFSLSEGGLIESRLASGQELDAAQLNELKKAAGLDKIYGNALRYVAMRLRSEWEMREYLRRKGTDEEPAEQIIAKLRNIGLLDDETFTRAWVSSRAFRNTSKRRLILELKQKHVPDRIVETVLQDEAPDERATLRQLITKKQARYPDRQKFMQYLARQGFGYDDIKTALDEI